MPDWVIPGIGLALSPLPVLAMLLVLGGRRPGAAGSAFWLALTLGVAAPTIAFVLAAERAGATDDESTAIAVGELAIGIVFLAVAVRLVLRPRPAARTPFQPGSRHSTDPGRCVPPSWA